MKCDGCGKEISMGFISHKRAKIYEFCYECDSRNLAMGKKIEDDCPKCGGVIDLFAIAPDGLFMARCFNCNWETPVFASKLGINQYIDDWHHLQKALEDYWRRDA